MVKKTTGKPGKTKPARTASKKTAGKAIKKSVKTASASKKVVKTAGSRKPAASRTAPKPSRISPKKKAAAAKQLKATTPSKAVKSVKRSAPVMTPAVKPKAEGKKKLSPREKMFLEIRKKLLQQKFDLLSEAEEALNELPGQTIFPDLGDQASAEIDRNFMLRLRGREQRLLKKIDEAIEKIDTGVFGVCDACGQEIDIKRLDARPVTNMCILCKTEQEEEEKARGI